MMWFKVIEPVFPQADVRWPMLEQCGFRHVRMFNADDEAALLAALEKHPLTRHQTLVSGNAVALEMLLQLSVRP